MARLLIIDDDVLLTNLLVEHFTSEGFIVSAAGTAGEGIERVLDNPPDLILLDLMLPDATGYQTCGKLREMPETRTVPIILMTYAARLPVQQALGRLMGANTCLVKPLNLIETSDHVHKLLRLDLLATEPSETQELPSGPSRLVFVSVSAALFDDSAR